MSSRYRNDASRTLKHYLFRAAEGRDIEGDPDCHREIEGIVDLIVDAAKEEARADMGEHVLGVTEDPVDDVILAMVFTDTSGSAEEYMRRVLRAALEAADILEIELVTSGEVTREITPKAGARLIAAAYGTGESDE